MGEVGPVAQLHGMTQLVLEGGDVPVRAEM